MAWANAHAPELAPRLEAPAMPAGPALPPAPSQPPAVSTVSDVPVVPDVAPAPLIPTEPVWPWAGRPSWDDAQAHPEAYGLWLASQNPGSRIERRWAKVTAYTPHEGSCGPSADGKTAVMANAWTYGVAVPQALLRAWRRAGTNVHVPGYMPETYPGQAWRPDDCGSALDASWRRGRLHVDVRYMNEGWAFQHWGTRAGWVWLLRKGT